MFSSHSWFEIAEHFIFLYVNDQSVVSDKAFPCYKLEYALSVGSHKILNAVCDLRVKSLANKPSHAMLRK